MKISKAAKRYAKALFTLARDEGRLDEVYRDLQVIRLWLTESGSFERFAEDPTIPHNRRTAVLDELLKGKANEITHRFALFLSDKSRLDELGGVIGQFELMYDEMHNVRRVEITGAMPLEDDQVSAIGTRFGAILGKQVKATVSLDPLLLGGFKVRIGDTIHDYSIQAQLESLRQNLIKA